LDSQELERTELQRKDRPQLMTIASALGGRPTSRTRKAELVDMILELAGVNADPSDGEPGDAPDPEAAVEPEATAVETKGEVSEEASADGSTSVADQADEAEADGDADDDSTTAVSDDAGDEAKGKSSAAGGRAREGRKRSASADEASSRGRGRNTRDRAANGRNEKGQNGRNQSERNSRGQSERSSRGQSERGQNERGQNERGQNERGQDERGPNERGQTERSSRGANERGPNERGPNDRNDRSGGARDDVEPGNRRRRRRGRGAGAEPSAEPYTGDPVAVEGLLDLRDEGYGFLRVKGMMPSKDDVYVSLKQVRQFGLRKGDVVIGGFRPASRNEKNPALVKIDSVNGLDAEQAKDRRRFEDLTPLYPDEKLTLERANDPSNMTTRIIDLISPIGKGQRGLIVSPPKAGKTTIMKQIAKAIEKNHPDVKLIVLLVDERPEEVTDMRRSVAGEVIASTFDRPAEEHTFVAELTIERAKRLVEQGDDVVVILDGITRLARAYNLAAPSTGRVMSGGVDTGALYPPKKFFGAARNVEEGGSLTILATALVDTGSRMDEVIFEEFKGTGNMELRLDREMAERRIYPAIDVNASSTRQEELLFDKKQLKQIYTLRRVLNGLTDGGNRNAGLELLINRMGSFKSNDEFLAEMANAQKLNA